MAEHITLSLLRAHIRSGGYQDDLHTETVYRLLFARWLAQQGVLNEWDVSSEDSVENNVKVDEFVTDTDVHATSLS